MRALITGVTGNVGQACAELLLREGWEVVGCARKMAGKYLPGMKCFTVDLSDPDEVSQTFAGLGVFNLVIMAHGTQHPARIGEADFESWYLEIIANNLTSAVHLTNDLIFSKQLAPGSLIVYYSSIHATQPRASRGPYAIAKAGLEALCRVVAIEQAPLIRAVALRLGQLKEPMKGIVFTPEQEAAIRNCTPYPWGDPADIAKLCLAFYGQKSLSGAVIDVDSAHSLNVWPGS